MSTYGDLLTAGNFVAGTVCADCLFGVEYDQWPSDDAHWTPDRAEKARAALSTYQVTVGHVHDGLYTTCPHAGSPCPDDCDCERTDFSNTTCSVCDSSLAGERHDVILVSRSDLK